MKGKLIKTAVIVSFVSSNNNQRYPAKWQHQKQRQPVQVNLHFQKNIT